MGNFKHENGKYYKTSDAPGTAENIIYSEGRSDDPHALNIQRPTGNMVDDLTKKVGTVYTIGKYDGDITGARLSSLGRKKRREAINTLLSKRVVNKAEKLFYNEYGLGEFANLFRKDGNLRRRAFRNQDFLNTISSREYSTNDVYKPSTNATLGTAADVISKNINTVVNPVLIKKVKDGHFETGWYKKSVPYLDWEEKKISGGCHTVNCKLRSINVLKLKYRDEDRYGRHWKKASYDNINSSVQSRDIYGQKPEMADFHALPLKERKETKYEEREQTIPEINPVEKAREYVLAKKATTLKASTGKSQQTNKAPINKTRQTKKKTATTTINTTTPNTRTTSFKERRPITITYLEDGTPISTEHGEWTRVN